MKSGARLAGTAIAVGAALCPTLAAPPPAHGAGSLISAGDRIDIDSDFCTLGYAFSTASHSYAITAGHCQADPGQRVRDHASGATGTFVRAVVDPPHSGGADYGLIDFGPHALVLPLVANLPLGPQLSDPPRPGQTICRTGATTATHCGSILGAYGPDQYLTADMAPSKGGDSGAPVWIPDDAGRAQVIGIWLGGYKTAADDDYGRFACLTEGFTALNIRH